MDSTITCTFCECGENHAGMQMIGEKAEKGDGYDLEDLQKLIVWCKENDVKYELHDLRPENEELRNKTPEAYILIMRDAVPNILGDNDPTLLYNELYNQKWDTKMLSRYGSVVNKHVRHNLIFADLEQEPLYEEGKGRIIDYKNLPLLSKIRTELYNILGSKAKDMVGEGNHYFAAGKTGIAWHGDTERRRVIGVRVGNPMPLWYRWYHGWKNVSDIIKFNLNGGDIYIMSEWAVGTEWKKSKLYTLRHCAGKTVKGKEFE